MSHATRHTSSRSGHSIDYPAQLLHQLSRLLPTRGLALMGFHARWCDRMLVLMALLMGWSHGDNLGERFTHSRATLVSMYPSRRRSGNSYRGFIATLMRHSTRLVELLTTHLREALRERVGHARFLVHGWCVFAVDGTKIELPRTDANIEAFGLANKPHAAPQCLMVALLHLASGVIWAFDRDRADGCERSMLRRMLGELPTRSLVVADAGYPGFEVMCAILMAGHQFVLRAGANVRLLRKLGLDAREHDGGIVYLWPAREQKRGRRPIVLRMLRVRDGRGRQMCLLTGVLDRARLSDEAMLDIYRQRWGIEVCYRELKQTMGHRKLASTSPTHAWVELDWLVMSQWALQVLELNVARMRRGVSGVLRVVREVMSRCAARTRRANILRRLREAVKPDRSRRTSAKQKRHWPRRPRSHRPGIALARTATRAEVLLCRTLTATPTAA